MIKLKNIIKEIADRDEEWAAGEWKSMERRKIDTFTKSYITSALWSSTDNLEPSGGDPLDKKYEIGDIENRTFEKMVKDCEDFQSKYGELYDKGGWDDEQAGHDFWLTRNGHGTGFWDRGYGQPDEIQEIGKQLTKAAKSYGSFDLYLGDGAYDGLVCGI